MLLKLLCLTVLATLSASDEWNESYKVDPIVYYLLNGEYEDKDTSTEIEEPVLNGGLWKCGQCDSLGESRLIYSEESPDADMDDSSVDIKIEVTLQGMRCVIVRSTSSSSVMIDKGACEGPSVTLTLAPAKAFVLDVYGNDIENRR